VILGVRAEDAWRASSGAGRSTRGKAAACSVGWWLMAGAGLF
jgi:hypothetical protein